MESVNYCVLLRCYICLEKIAYNEPEYYERLVKISDLIAQCIQEEKGEVLMEVELKKEILKIFEVNNIQMYSKTTNEEAFSC